jgi:hypothetical protein
MNDKIKVDPEKFQETLLMPLWERAVEFRKKVHSP